MSQLRIISAFVFVILCFSCHESSQEKQELINELRKKNLQIEEMNHEISKQVVNLEFLTKFSTHILHRQNIILQSLKLDTLPRTPITTEGSPKLFYDKLGMNLYELDSCILILKQTLNTHNKSMDVIEKALAKP